MKNAYDRSLVWVLRRQGADAAGVRRARWPSTALLFVVVPKGFFPVQDTGAHHRRDRGARRRSRSPASPSASRRWSNALVADPAVESLSSFVGVDGTNVTPNSGRVQINLKPLDRARATTSAR